MPKIVSLPHRISGEKLQVPIPLLCSVNGLPSRGCMSMSLTRYGSMTVKLNRSVNAYMAVNICIVMVILVGAKLKVRRISLVLIS